MLDLESIELIKQLKARYFRFLDTRNLDGLKTVFTHDATASFIGGDYDFQLDGWEQLEAFYKKSFTGQNFGMHNGHHLRFVSRGPRPRVFGISKIFLYPLSTA